MSIAKPLTALVACFVIACGNASADTTKHPKDAGGDARVGARIGTGGSWAEAGNPSGSDAEIGSDAEVGSDAEPGGSGGGPTIGGCPLFSPDHPYNRDISAAALDPNSATYIANLKSRTGAINAPHSASEFVNVVPASQPDVSIQFKSSSYGIWGFDSNDAFYHSSPSTVSAPVPQSAVYENMDGAGENHMLVVQQGVCRLFEFYSSNASSATTNWGAMVTWNLTKNEQLPDGWGSTTAAGTPVLPGVIWYDEVKAGKIEHAIDIVIPGADIAAYEYVKPAARSGGACGSPYPLDGFPYGGRLRLKASFDASKLTGSQALVIIRALQKYGMISTDDSGYDRSDFRLGPGDWDLADLDQLAQLTWDDFEVPAMTVIDSKACN